MPLEIKLDLYDPALRVACILSPTVNATVQELVNFLREEEAHLWNMNFNALIDATGKDDLGMSQYTAITMTMLGNLVLKFEDRAGPDYIACKVLQGNLVAKNAMSPPWSSIDPFIRADYVWVQYAQSTAPAAMLTGGSALTPEEHDQLMATALEASLADTADLIQQVREGNMRRRYYKAVAQDPVRRVEVGKLDRVVIEYKKDADPDWSTPELTQTLWAWYENLGDDNPYLVGEDG